MWFLISSASYVRLTIKSIVRKSSSIFEAQVVACSSSSNPFLNRRLSPHAQVRRRRLTLHDCALHLQRKSCSGGQPDLTAHKKVRPNCCVAKSKRRKCCTERSSAVIGPHVSHMCASTGRRPHARTRCGPKDRKGQPSGDEAPLAPHRSAGVSFGQ